MFPGVTERTVFRREDNSCVLAGSAPKPTDTASICEAKVYYYYQMIIIHKSIQQYEERVSLNHCGLSLKYMYLVN